jgi:dihydroorotate dehydrogenase electron transfer subunit
MNAKHERRCARHATVTRCAPLCREHVVIDVELDEFPNSQPGQFLQLLCHQDSSEADLMLEWRESDGFPSLRLPETMQHDAFLRRPFSIADHVVLPNRRTRLSVISRNVGVGTAFLEHLRVGDLLDLTGPLGRGFEIPPARTPLVLVGGGVGIPPLLYLARRLHELAHTDVTVIIGAQSNDLLPVQLTGAPDANGAAKPCVAYPGDAPYSTIITTDDGSVGLRGLVTDGLEAWHRQHAGETNAATVFACGPEGMLQGVAEVTRRLSLACQLCIERNMGCGLGTCLSCVVRARDDEHPRGWQWKLACTDGPVFDRDALLDYGPKLATR